MGAKTEELAAAHPAGVGAECDQDAGRVELADVGEIILRPLARALLRLFLLLGHIGLRHELLAKLPDLLGRKSLAQQRLVEPGGLAVDELAPLAPQRLLEENIRTFLEPPH